jgi:hypothetical protein
MVGTPIGSVRGTRATCQEPPLALYGKVFLEVISEKACCFLAFPDRLAFKVRGIDFDVFNSITGLLAHRLANSFVPPRLPASYTMVFGDELKLPIGKSRDMAGSASYALDTSQTTKIGEQNIGDARMLIAGSYLHS